MCIRGDRTMQVAPTGFTQDWLLVTFLIFGWEGIFFRYLGGRTWIAKVLLKTDHG